MIHLTVLFKWILFNFKKSQISEKKNAKQNMLFFFKLETVLPQLLLQLPLLLHYYYCRRKSPQNMSFLLHVSVMTLQHLEAVLDCKRPFHTPQGNWQILRGRH